MPILENCRDSSEVIIKYQLWEPPGIELTFSTDGTEDSDGYQTGWTKRFFPSRTEYYTKHNYPLTKHAVWLSAVSQTNFNDGFKELLFCGDTVYLRWTNIYGKAPEKVQKEGGFNFYGVYYNEQFSRNFDDFNLVKPEVYSAQKTTKNYEDNLISGEDYVRLLSEHDGSFIHPPDSNCYRAGSKHPTRFHPKPGTLQYLGHTYIQEYFDIFVINDRGGKALATTRTTKPISVKEKPAELLPEETIVLNKKADTEDFEVEVGSNYLKFWRINVNTNSRTRIKTVSRFFYNAEPVWTHECGQQCPENTCKVDCGTHYCCYGSDGIAVHSFLK